MSPLARRRLPGLGHRFAGFAACVVACSSGNLPSDPGAYTPSDAGKTNQFAAGAGGQAATPRSNQAGMTSSGAGGTGGSGVPSGGGKGPMLGDGAGRSALGGAAGQSVLGGAAGQSVLGGAAGRSALGGAGSGQGGAAGRGGAGTIGTAGATASGPATFSAVAAIIQQRCALAACHGGGRAPRLTNNSSLYKTLTSTTVKECGGTQLVTPNDPANSALLQLPNWECDNLVMPQGCIDMPCLADAELLTISAWIQAGAPGP